MQTSYPAKTTCHILISVNGFSLDWQMGELAYSANLVIRTLNSCIFELDDILETIKSIKIWVFDYYYSTTKHFGYVRIRSRIRPW